ncbi:MAG: AAA family ATPase [Candidatus Doudnabacteria bacterium]|nr:AAA family ATPase [Candidatus Doudnabacteria bacterium]
MYLKRLELQGFKSFAHKTILDFDPGMTAVVGPNGSGKSNIADALRWVMGEQSLKLLRGKKSEDVIFAGSDKKSKLSVAEVALTFDNKDRKIPLEYSEVVMTRRLYRNGESEYLINNQRARLLDVVDALMRSGFGATNYAVIGQGTIEQMILAGPAEIKNLVEEASGVKPYYLKREKTIRKLEQTSENLARVSELLAEIEPRLRSLKRQAKRMEEREEMANQLKVLQMEYFGNQYYLLETELNAVVEQLALKSNTIQSLQNEIDSFQKTLEKEEQQTGRSNSFVDELDKKLQNLEEQKLNLLEQLAEIKGKLKLHLNTVSSNKFSLEVFTNKFSQFKNSFEAILESLTTDNVHEIKQRLKELVFDFGKISDSGTHEVEKQNEELLSQKRNLDMDLELIVKEIHEQNRLKNKLLTEERQKKSFLTEEEKKFRQKTSELSSLKDAQNSILVEKAKLDTRLESLNKEVHAIFGLIPQTLDQYKKDHIDSSIVNQISKLKHQLELAGGIDESTLIEYRETQERYDYLHTQSTDLSQAVVDLRNVIEELDQIIKKQFDDAFDKISNKFSEYFRILFNGGQAKMTLMKESQNELEGSEESLDEVENMKPVVDGLKKKRSTPVIVGIEIKATPPGKKLATINALSGGERALTAIALLCSMLASYPSPFVVLDEVDAALDEANSIRLGKILATLVHQTQFITITHNRETMRQAHTLYGVTMSDEGISKILSLKLEQAEKVTS